MPFQSCHHAGVHPYRKSRSAADATATIFGVLTGWRLDAVPAVEHVCLASITECEQLRRLRRAERANPLQQLAAFPVPQPRDEADGRDPVRESSRVEHLFVRAAELAGDDE